MIVDPAREAGVDLGAAAAVNQAIWTDINDQFTDARADDVWQQDEITWGIFDIPDAQVGALGDVRGLDVAELGCGTAYFSARLARAGARPVGVDLTPAQLATARRCQQRYGPVFPLVAADATRVPLPDASFDLVVSEYGASVWCDSPAWIAQAARLLRPGGRLVFLTCSVLVTLCVPEEGGHATGQLQRPQREKYVTRWAGGGVEYHPSHGDWIRELTGHGFVVEALHELYAPDDAQPAPFYEIAQPEWAQQWPAEDLWVARRAAPDGD